MNEQEQPIWQVLEAYKASVKAKDVEAFVSLYEQDVVIFDTWSEWSYQGVEAWRQMVVDWFGSLGSELVIVEANDSQLIADNNLAVIHASVSFKAVSAEGNELRSIQNRFTWVLQNKNGHWKICHEHSSLPIDFETFKGIFKG